MIKSLFSRIITEAVRGTEVGRTAESSDRRLLCSFKQMMKNTQSKSHIYYSCWLKEDVVIRRAIRHRINLQIL